MKLETEKKVSVLEGQKSEKNKTELRVRTEVRVQT